MEWPSIFFLFAMSIRYKGRIKNNTDPCNVFLLLTVKELDSYAKYERLL